MGAEAIQSGDARGEGLPAASRKLSCLKIPFKNPSLSSVSASALPFLNLPGSERSGTTPEGAVGRSDWEEAGVAESAPENGSNPSSRRSARGVPAHGAWKSRPEPPKRPGAHTAKRRKRGGPRRMRQSVAQFVDSLDKGLMLRAAYAESGA